MALDSFHRSEMRMRKHASKQNSIPNNQRVLTPSVVVNNTHSTNNDYRASCRTTRTVISMDNSSGGGDGDGSGLSRTPTTRSKVSRASRIKDTRDVKAKRNEWRITKMVLAIFLSFVCCYLPITLTKVADKDVRYPAFHIIGYIMLYLSSCINPIIYVIMNKQYRQAYKTVILCQPGRLLAFTGAGSSVGGK